MEYKNDTYSRFNSVGLVLATTVVFCALLTGCTKTPSGKRVVSPTQPTASNSRVEVVTAVQKDVVHTTSQPATCLLYTSPSPRD